MCGLHCYYLLHTLVLDRQLSKSLTGNPWLKRILADSFAQRQYPSVLEVEHRCLPSFNLFINSAGPPAFAGDLSRPLDSCTSFLLSPIYCRNKGGSYMLFGNFFTELTDDVVRKKGMAGPLERKTFQ